MADLLKLQVVTPERRVVETDADGVELPGVEGYLGILPGHTPLVTLLKPGVLSFRRGASAQAFAISAGIAEISDNRVSVLADSAQAPAEIDVAAAERERAEAEKEMSAASFETLPEITARVELAKAKLAVARRG